MTLPRFVASLWLEGFSLPGDLRFDFVGMGLSFDNHFVTACIGASAIVRILRGPEAR
jgi:hypothetical protein